MNLRKYLLSLTILFLSKCVFGDSLVLVTQEKCPPCVVAKKLLAETNLQGLKLEEVDVKDAAKYFVRTTPTLVLLTDEGKFVASVNKVDKAHITYILSVAEVEAIQPLKLPDFIAETKETDKVETAAPRRIPYTISTQYRNGIYQGSFTWGQVDHGLTLLERYWNIDFVRVNSGQTLRIIQANTNGPVANAAAWTRGRDIYISPTYNFSNLPALCEMVICHEFGHAAGGGSHDTTPATLMHTNGGYIITQSTYRWFNAYQWKGSLRPHTEPAFAREYWKGNVPINASVEELPIQASTEELPIINCVKPIN